MLSVKVADTRIIIIGGKTLKAYNISFFSSYEETFDLHTTITQMMLAVGAKRTKLAVIYINGSEKWRVG